MGASGPRLAMVDLVSDGNRDPPRRPWPSHARAAHARAVSGVLDSDSVRGRRGRLFRHRSPAIAGGRAADFTGFRRRSAISSGNGRFNKDEIYIVIIGGNRILIVKFLFFMLKKFSID